jgi:hypothetical protein
MTELQVVHRDGPEEPTLRAGSGRQSDRLEFYDNPGRTSGKPEKVSETLGSLGAYVCSTFYPCMHNHTVTFSQLHPSLIFASKAGGYPRDGLVCKNDLIC